MSKKAVDAMPFESSECLSSLLAQQTAAFLKEGGNIQEIETGVSGQQNISYFLRSNQSVDKASK